jgi:hypothetical protein
MKLIILFALFIIAGNAYSQVSVEKSGSPDLKLYNINALNTGVSSRMLFKTGTYFTGAIGTTGTTASTANLSFFTQSTSDQNALLERMTILNNGFVGIANSNPLYQFHVKASGIGITQESTSGTVKVGFYTSSNEAYVQTHNSIPLYFATNNSSAQMALTTTGRLGIGTTAPSTKLEVKGKTKVIQQAGEDAALEVSGNIKFTGANPVAFVATATETNQIIIDHPASNGNPNAIILVTPRQDPNTYFNGSIAVQYVTNIGKWRIIPTGNIDIGVDEVALLKCNDDCYHTSKLALAEDSHFVLDSQYWNADTFNVLIISN